MSEEFLEIGLARVLGRTGDDLFADPDGGLARSVGRPRRLGLPDAVMALAIDALSLERTGMLCRYINYRDLSVQ